MESSNLSLDMTQSIIEFKMRLLEEALRVSPKRIFVVPKASLNSKMQQLILLILSIRFIVSFI